MGTNRDLRRAGHKVMVLHKMDDTKTSLDVDKVKRFPNSGSRYLITETGAVVNPDKKRNPKRISIG